MTRKFFIFFLSLWFCTNVQAQDLPMGGWRTHLPFSQAQCVEPVGVKIFVGTQGGLFAYDSTDNSIEMYTSVNGLSDQNIKTISYNDPTQTLVIGYASGNIDLWKNGSVRNINAIVNKNFPVNKNIYHIIQKGRKAYVATGFGIIEVDIDLGEIKNTFLIGQGSTYVGCYQLADDGTSLFAATDSGIYYSNWNAPNMSDYQYWKMNEKWGKIETRCIASAKNGILLASKGDTLFSNRNGLFSPIYTATNPIRKIRMSNNRISVSIFYRQIELDELGNVIQQSGIDARFQNINDAFTDNQNHTWLADGNTGLGYYHDFYMLKFVPNGPGSIEAFELISNNSETFVASGGLTKSFGNLFSKGGIYRFDGNSWKNYNEITSSITDETRDFICVRKNPLTSQWYASTWTRGLLEFDGDSLIHQYETAGTALKAHKNSNPGNDFVRVGYMDFDKSGNLWMTNYESNTPLVVKKTDGTWESYPLPGGIGKAVYFLIDDFDQKWVVIPGLGVVVYSKDMSQSILLNNNAGTGNIHNATIQCISKDRDGVVWLGTPEGPTAFYNPGGIFNSSEINAQRVKIDKNQFDNFVDYLLEDQSINDITIDGANRKWFATHDGVWLMTADCQTLIHHFTQENSPLLSNNVLSISVDGKTGEVFFGTDAGICSYRGDATDGEIDAPKVKVFPNPARPELDGPIAVQLLNTDSWVKFVDISGTLVYQTKAMGGTATWNGKDLKGNRVETGTYLILASDDYGIYRQVGKVYLVK